MGRSEFGIEIVLALSYQVHCLGLSMGKACKVFAFFQQLDLKKSQADRLLNQLAKAWSIGKQVEAFTLFNVIAEVKQWMIRGKSCFAELASKAATQATPGILDRLVLQADEPAISESG